MGHELHIRAINVNPEQYDLFYKNDNFIIEGALQDKKYSTSYNTIFITNNGEFVPCVLSYGEL